MSKRSLNSRRSRRVCVSLVLQKFMTLTFYLSVNHGCKLYGFFQEVLRTLKRKMEVLTVCPD